MTNTLSRMLAGTIAVTLLASCSTPWKQPSPIQPTDEALDISKDLHRVVNRYRKDNHRNSIERHPGLDEIALNHTRYLVKRRGTSIIHGRNVTHIGSGWRTIAANREYGMIRYGENVAAITTKPDSPHKHLLLMWKTSYQHNENMLADWTHTGIGTLIDDDGAVFVTQVFGLKDKDKE